MWFGKVVAVYFDKGYGKLVDVQDGVERLFDLKVGVEGEYPWKGVLVSYVPQSSKKGGSAPQRATSVRVVIEPEIPAKKLPIAEKIMAATRALAELQEGRQHIQDGVGFGSAHWKLGLVLADMWDYPDTSINRMDIVRGSAYLLFRHSAQAEKHGVTESMIGSFLPYVQQREASLKSVREKASKLAGDWVRWKLFEYPVCYMQLTAGGSGGNAGRAITSAAHHLGISLHQDVAGPVLLVPEKLIGSLIQWAAANVYFRGCMEIGRKMPFDRLSERFCPKPVVTDVNDSVAQPRTFHVPATAGAMPAKPMPKPAESEPKLAHSPVVAKPIQDVAKHIIPRTPKTQEPRFSLRVALSELLRRLFKRT
ncbi:hypothetical protein [Ralstonia pseudosolanacearum]|uniref:hypothetical protein n=1 Tax=Ralstonia pseudosolanacearum TaxID=1310165 RepID=UPI003CF6A299